MFYGQFELITGLQYKVKSLSARVRAFETGEKYTAMKAAMKAQRAEKDKEIRALKAELEAARTQAATVGRRGASEKEARPHE